MLSRYLAKILSQVENDSARIDAFHLRLTPYRDEDCLAQRLAENLQGGVVPETERLQIRSVLENGAMKQVADCTAWGVRFLATSVLIKEIVLLDHGAPVKLRWSREDTEMRAQMEKLEALKANALSVSEKIAPELESALASVEDEYRANRPLRRGYEDMILARITTTESSVTPDRHELTYSDVAGIFPRRKRDVLYGPYPDYRGGVYLGSTVWGTASAIRALAGCYEVTSLTLLSAGEESKDAFWDFLDASPIHGESFRKMLTSVISATAAAAAAPRAAPASVGGKQRPAWRLIPGGKQAPA